MAFPPGRSDQKSLLKSDALYEYILDTNVYPREHKCLKELREITANVPLAFIAVLPDELAFLGMLIKLMNVKNALEIGVFTGNSLLTVALALPHDGKIIGIDIDRELYEKGLPVIEKAGVSHKVDFRHGSALPILDQLLTEEKNEGKFDFAFVDADKENYLNYHEKLLKLVKIGGVIAYDNSLYGGFILPSAEVPGFVLPSAEVPNFKQSMINRDAIIEVNKALSVDQRIEVCQLSIGDGLTLCRRIS